jgi:hypothetical protein
MAKSSARRLCWVIPVVLGLAMLGFVLSGCGGDEEPAPPGSDDAGASVEVQDESSVGDRVDDALDTAGDATERSLDTAGDEVDNAMDKAGDAVDRAGEEVDKALDKAGRAVRDALD